MKLLSTVIAALALLPLGMVSAEPAKAATEKVCYNFTDHLYLRKCVPFVNDASEMQKIVNYPTEIVVTRKRDWRNISSGWEVSKANCHNQAKKYWSHDDRVNLAKFYYCELNKRGVELPKPHIVKAF